MKRASAVIVFVALAGVGCSKRSKPVEAVSGFEAAPATRMAAEQRDQLAALGYLAKSAPSQGAGANAAPAPAPASASAQTVAPRATSSLKLIWTASLQVEVADFQKAVQEASAAAQSFGGYVSDRQSSEDGSGRHHGTITLRIPSARFEGAMGTLKKLGRVRNEGVNTQDVTKQYADLETRLKVKRETATRLREILVRQTGKVSEVLEVEREIARVVEEIEHAEGERLYFDNLISLSTITLQLNEPDSIVTPGVFDSIKAVLKQSLRTMSDSVEALILITAGLLPWLIVLYVFYRIVRRRWSRRATVPVRAEAALPPQ